jgi:hypothetical protein
MVGLGNRALLGYVTRTIQVAESYDGRLVNPARSTLQGDLTRSGFWRLILLSRARCQNENQNRSGHTPDFHFQPLPVWDQTVPQLQITFSGSRTSEPTGRAA